LRILFVHEVSYSLKPVFEYQEFIDGLLEIGNETALFNFVDGPKPISIERFSATLPRRLNPRGQILTFTPMISGSSIVARLMAALTAFVALPLALIRFKPEIIVNYSVPTFGLPVVVFSRLLGIPVVFRSIDVSHQIRNTAFSRLVKIWETLVYVASDHISTHNSSLLDYCVKMGGRRDRTSIDYPPVQDAFFRVGEMDQEESRKLFGIGEPSKGTRYLVLGTQFSFSGVDKLVRCFREHGGAGDSLIVIGGGELETVVDELARGDGRILSLPFIPFDQVPSALRVADVSLVTFESNLVTNCALPQRALLSLAAGVPVMSLPLSGLMAEFGDMGVNVVERHEDFFDQTKLSKNSKPNVQKLWEVLSREQSVHHFSKLLMHTAAS